MKKMLCCVCLLAATSVAQAPTPPVKMGLWHGTSVSKMTGMNIPPEVAERMKQAGRSIPGSEPRTTETESCLTPEKWKDMFLKSQESDSCKLQNIKQDSSGMSADVTCESARGGSGKGQFHIDFVSNEKVKGAMHMEMSSPRQPQPIVMDMTYESAYVGSDCKDVSPDSPKMIRR